MRPSILSEVKTTTDTHTTLINDTAARCFHLRTSTTTQPSALVAEAGDLVTYSAHPRRFKRVL